MKSAQIRKRDKMNFCARGKLRKRDPAITQRPTVAVSTLENLRIQQIYQDLSLLAPFCIVSAFGSPRNCFGFAAVFFTVSSIAVATSVPQVARPSTATYAHVRAMVRRYTRTAMPP